MKSQNPFSKTDPHCTQCGLLEEKCINMGERQEKKTKCCESVVLRNASLESDLCLKAVLSVEYSRTERHCDNSLYQRLKLCQLLSFVWSTLWRSAGVLVFQQRQCRGNNQPALSHCRPYAGQTQQPCHSVNTEGKKRCSIVLQRPMGCLGIMTPCLSGSSFLWPMNEHWWSSRTGCGYRFSPTSAHRSQKSRGDSRGITT